MIHGAMSWTILRCVIHAIDWYAVLQCKSLGITASVTLRTITQWYRFQTHNGSYTMCQDVYSLSQCWLLRLTSLNVILYNAELYHVMHKSSSLGGRSKLTTSWTWHGTRTTAWQHMKQYGNSSCIIDDIIHTQRHDATHNNDATAPYTTHIQSACTRVYVH